MNHSSSIFILIVVLTFTLNTWANSCPCATLLLHDPSSAAAVVGQASSPVTSSDNGNNNNNNNNNEDDSSLNENDANRLQTILGGQGGEDYPSFIDQTSTSSIGQQDQQPQHIQDFHFQSFYPLIRQVKSPAALLNARKRFKRPSWATVGKRSAAIVIAKRPSWAQVG